VSQTSASLILAVLTLLAAFYFFFVPPPGLDEGFMNRMVLPYLLLVTAFGILESLRTRAHMAQLIGALRSMMGKSGKPATPEVRREAVDILLKALRGENEQARATALAQLKTLTGQDLGDDPAAWEDWWRRNRGSFQ